MAVVFRTRSFATYSRLLSGIRPISSSATQHNEQKEVMTHTGQEFQLDDYRRMRFESKGKLVNPRFAIDLIREDPVVVCEQRVIFSDGGGALGHPKVYINLDKPGVHSCGYSGRKFVLKKYYDEKTMGPSITHQEYLQQIRPQGRD